MQNALFKIAAKQCSLLLIMLDVWVWRKNPIHLLEFFLSYIKSCIWTYTRCPKNALLAHFLVSVLGGVFSGGNKPKGLKVAKEDKRSKGLMVNGLDG